MQAGRQKHTVLDFFQWQAWLDAVGRTHSVRTSHNRMVIQPTADVHVHVGGSNPGRPTASRVSKVADRESNHQPAHQRCITIRLVLVLAVIVLPTA